MNCSFAVFGLKFRSIQRHYQVLHGEDPFKGFDVNEEQIQYLCEQGLRNLRLRCVQSYLSHAQQVRRYEKYLCDLHIAVFTFVSEILRLDGIKVPDEPDDRIKLIGDFFDIDVAVLGRLSDVHSKRVSVKKKAIEGIHREVFEFLNSIIGWIEGTWPARN